MRFVLAFVLLVGLLGAGPNQMQWAQYPGPITDITSPETGLLDQWPADRPSEVWRIEYGQGFGGAAVQGGQVIIHNRVHREADILRVLELKAGIEKWCFQCDAAGGVGHGGSRCMPSVTDTYLLTNGQMGDLYAFDRKTRRPAWPANLLDKYPDTGRQVDRAGRGGRGALPRQAERGRVQKTIRSFQAPDAKQKKAWDPLTLTLAGTR